MQGGLGGAAPLHWSSRFLLSTLAVELQVDRSAGGTGRMEEAMQLTPLYLLGATIVGLLLSPALARAHLTLAETTEIRESPELMARHARHVRNLSRVYRTMFLVLGTLAMVSWFTGYGWD